MSICFHISPVKTLGNKSLDIAAKKTQDNFTPAKKSSRDEASGGATSVSKKSRDEQQQREQRERGRDQTNEHQRDTLYQDSLKRMTNTPSEER